MAKTKKEEAASNEVAVTGGNVATYAYGSEDGTGFENQTQADVKIPWLKLLQDTNPEVKRGGLEGAEAGMLLIGDDELYGEEEGIVIIPCFTEHTFVEWEPRDKGGKFVARHDITSQVVADAKAKYKFGEYKTEAGNDLVDTFYVYAITEHDLAPLIIGFNSTKISVYQTWMGKLRKHLIQLENGNKVNPPLFANRVRITSKGQKNNKGDFFNFVISPAEEDITDAKTGEVVKSALAASLLPPDDERLKTAVEVKKIIQSGQAKVDFNAQTAESEATQEDGKAHF